MSGFSMNLHNVAKALCHATEAVHDIGFAAAHTPSSIADNIERCRRYIAQASMDLDGFSASVARPALADPAP